MWTRAALWAVVVSVMPLLDAALPKPADWVPARWPWADTQSLQLLEGTPVNCLLLNSPTSEFVDAAKARGVVVLSIKQDEAGDIVLAGETDRDYTTLFRSHSGQLSPSEFPDI